MFPLYRSIFLSGIIFILSEGCPLTFGERLLVMNSFRFSKFEKSSFNLCFEDIFTGCRLLARLLHPPPPPHI